MVAFFFAQPSPASDLDTNALVSLLLSKKWLAATAIVIFWTVRLLKSDTKIPIDIPPKWRVWLALGLGIAAGVIEALASAKPWLPALLDGLIGAGLAIVYHNAAVDSLRGGREGVIPGLIKPGVPPGPNKPPSIPPTSAQESALAEHKLPPPPATPSPERSDP